MPQVHSSKEALRALANQLQEFSERTREHWLKVTNSLQDIQESAWRDQQLQTYAEAFQEAANQLQTVLVDVSQHHTQFLMALAEQLEGYEGQRYG